MSWDALTRYFSLVEGLGTVVAMATADPGEGRITRAGDRLEPLGLPGVAIAVADILPPRPS